MVQYPFNKGVTMNYQTCTTEELAIYFGGKTTQAITQQLKYYQSRGNEEVVVKIKKARLLNNQRKLIEKLGSL